MFRELTSIGNELRKRGLKKEAYELDRLMVKNAEPFTLLGLSGLALWGAIAGTAAATIGLTVAKMSQAEKEVWSRVEGPVVDLGMEEAGNLYERWRAALLVTDLIDGWGSFPKGDPNGGKWVREVFDKKFLEAKEGGNGRLSESGTPDSFQDSLDTYFGGGTAEVWMGRFGTDNEEGWTKSFNTIIDLLKFQSERAKLGLDWKTGKPIGEKADLAPWENTPAQIVAGTAGAEAAETASPELETAVADVEEEGGMPDTFDEAVRGGQHTNLWDEVMGNGSQG